MIAALCVVFGTIF